MKSIRLGAYMIVRNERALIERALSSLHSVDELIVADTGSTDGTQELIATSFPDVRLLQTEWDDDFARARNFARMHATADWCIILDADEYLSPMSVSVIREAIISRAQDDQNAFRLLCQAERVPRQKHTMIRVHRNKPDIFWIGAIHEALNVFDETVIEGAILTYGYSPSHEKDPERTMRILEREHARMPDEPRTLYYLAREHFNSFNYKRATELFERRVKQPGYLPELADAWLYLARSHWINGRPDDARTACAQALVVNADFREALMFMAEMSWPHNASRWREYAMHATNERVLFIR
jgi:glycosyltransferase involved in cell wall biosynthesis